MKTHKKSFAGTRPVFTVAPVVEIGGFTVDKTKQNLVVGDVIPEGTLVLHDEVTRKVLLVKTGKVKSISQTDTKIVTLESNDFMNPNFAVGDKVAKVAGGALASAITISKIEDGDNGYVVTLSSAISGLAVGDIIGEVMSVETGAVVAGIITADNSNKIYMVTPGLDIAAGDKLFKGTVDGSALIANAVTVESYDKVSGKLVTATAVSSGAAGDKLTKVQADATVATKAVAVTQTAGFLTGTALTISPIEVKQDEICVDITANTGNGSCFIRRILPIHADQLAENGMFLKANPSIRFTNSK